MPGVQAAFSIGYERSSTGGIVLKLTIWCKDFKESPGISVPLIVPGDLEIFKAIWLFNLTNSSGLEQEFSRKGQELCLKHFLEPLSWLCSNRFFHQVLTKVSESLQL